MPALVIATQIYQRGSFIEQAMPGKDIKFSTHSSARKKGKCFDGAISCPILTFASYSQFSDGAHTKSVHTAFVTRSKNLEDPYRNDFLPRDFSVLFRQALRACFCNNLQEKNLDFTRSFCCDTKHIQGHLMGVEKTANKSLANQSFS